MVEDRRTRGQSVRWSRWYLNFRCVVTLFEAVTRNTTPQEGFRMRVRRFLTDVVTSPASEWLLCRVCRPTASGRTATSTKIREEPIVSRRRHCDTPLMPNPPRGSMLVAYGC